MALESGFWAADVEGIAQRMNASLCQKGLTADLPAHDANLTGRWYYDSQTKLLRRDAASAWESLDLGGHAVDMSYLDLTNRELDDKYREFISWTGSDGFTVGGDTGYVVNFQGPVLSLYVPANTNYDAFCHSKYGRYYHPNTAGKLIAVEFTITDMINANNLNCWLRMGQVINDPPSETNDHFGWKIIGNDLYASNASGTTQTIEDTTINLSTGAQRTRLKTVFNPTVDVKYYVNDVLTNTITTNLPNTTGYYLFMQLRTLTATMKEIRLGRILMEFDN